MHIAFFIYHYNDADQACPVIWKLLDRGHKVTAIMLNDSFDAADDPRFALLRDFDTFDEIAVGEFIDAPFSAWLFRQHKMQTAGAARRAIRKILRETGLSVRWAKNALQRLGVEACVFDWGGLGARNRTEILLAARELKLRTLSLPQGAYIFQNTDTNPAVTAAVARGEKPRADYNVYDAYVFQASYHMAFQIDLGLDPEMCKLIGSARYCPEWLAVNDGLYEDYIPKKSAGDRLKIVIMMQSWNYNIDKEATLNGIEAMASENSIFLVVKDRPQKEAASIPPDMRERLEMFPNVEVIGNEAHSTSLMRWADAVLNYASGVSIEATANGTPVIYPRYMHGNKTIYDVTGAAINVDDPNDLVPALLRLRNGVAKPASSTGHADLMKAAVYGDREPFDVLGEYADLITEEAS